MENYIENDLLQQKKLLLNILELTIKQLEFSYDALLKENQDEAKKVIKKDIEINKLHDNFINTSLWKIAKQQMVAKDLRRVVGFIIIVREIERIADYAVHLAKYFIKYKPSNELIERNLKKPIKKIIKMLNFLNKILVSDNLIFSNKFSELEKENNEIFKENTKELLTKLQNTTDKTKVKLISVTLQQLKYIERASDHVINVIEMLIFIQKGKFLDLLQIAEI